MTESKKRPVKSRDELLTVTLRKMQTANCKFAVMVIFGRKKTYLLGWLDAGVAWSMGIASGAAPHGWEAQGRAFPAFLMFLLGKMPGAN